MELSILKRTELMTFQNGQRYTSPLRAILAATVLVSFAASVPAAHAPAGNVAAEQHKLWHDHVALTRAYLLAAAANQPSAKPTLRRLLQNQVDLGNAFKPYCGNAAGNHLTALLKEHILIAGKIIESGKKAPLPSVPAIGEWYKNADQIAALFSRMNPQAWRYGEMKNMMHHHLNITTSEVLSCLHAGTGADAYKGVHRQAMEMADMLTTGIQKQFGGARVASR
jgi:hypothetical protein